jgi:3-deoxy-D-manno-octulosonic-acid transferase
VWCARVRLSNNVDPAEQVLKQRSSSAEQEERDVTLRASSSLWVFFNLRLVRWIYTLVMYLATPIIFYRLISRGLKNQDYFGRWRERFGYFEVPNNLNLAGSIWVHAVSVGEFNAAIPLIEALMKRFPERPMVISTITPTGSARVKQVLRDRVFHVYLPYDLPGSVNRFLTRVQPKIAIVMETEIWPNLYLSCSQRRIPILIANARLSERSLRGYGPAMPLAGHCVRQAAWIAAQSRIDAERFLRLGADPDRLELVGNIKFDMAVSDAVIEKGRAYRQHWGATRPVWIAASTHEGEEAAALESHSLVLQQFSDAMLIVVPRHPERFKQVVQMCKTVGFRTSTRSENLMPEHDTQCFVLDSMGELMAFFAACDVAFVGGSLATIGGHNVLEPASLGLPVLVGPHTHNFEEINERLSAAGALILIHNGVELGQGVTELFSDASAASVIGSAGARVVKSERGALERLMGRAEKLLENA